MPKVKELLQDGRRRLAALETADLDAGLLLATAAGRNRAQLLAHPEDTLPEKVVLHYRRLLQERARGIPLAYLRGEREFYGRSFAVSEDVLVPRPETEDLCRHAWQSSGTYLVDIGTGSGCIAVTSALEQPQLTVWGTDVSAPALTIARRNAARHGAAVTWYEADLLAVLDLPPPGETVLVANLPYVASAACAEPSIAAEPRLALDGGPDGLSLIKRLLAQCRERAYFPRALWLEIGSEQAGAIADLAWGPCQFFPDISGRIRYAKLLP